MVSSPGGTNEVGRVSIRVLPDTGGFRRDLKAAVDSAEAGLEVKIPVEFDVDTAGLVAQIESIKAKVTIPVDFDVDTAGLRARIEALDSSQINIPVELELRDIERLNATLARLSSKSIKLQVKANGVSQAIAQLTALHAVIQRIDGRRINVNVDVDAAAAMAQLAAVEAAMAGLRVSLGSIGTSASGSGGFGGMNRIVMNTVQLLTQAIVIAPLLAVAGAAVTAAWGALATTIAAIPAGLSLILAPVGAIMAGLDGIKAAAKTIKPEFDALQKAVSATFETRMVPIFKTLATTFPTLTTGLQSMAGGVSNVAQRLVDMVASVQGIARLNAIFTNVHATLTSLTPSISRIVDGFLIVASQAGGFEALSSAVRTFGEAFRASVLDLVGGGQLTAAFAGLRGMLDQLAIGFVQLVDNGIRVFAAAAPGVNQFLASLTGFFERFDWASLGTSVGGVFSGLASALDMVPQGVIDDIAVAFQELAATFQSTDFQAQLANIVAGIPDAIRFIQQLVQGFGTIGSAVSSAIQWLQQTDAAMAGFNQGVKTVVTSVIQFFRNLGTALLGIGQMIVGGAQAWGVAFQAMSDPIGALQGKYSQGFADAGAAIREGWGTLSTSFATGAGELEADAAAAGERWTTALGEANKMGLNSVADATGAQLGRDGVGAAISQASKENEAAAKAGSALIPPAVTGGLEPTAPAAAGVLNQLAPVMASAMGGLAIHASMGMAKVAAGVTQGMVAVTGALTTGMASLAPVLTGQFGALAIQTNMGMVQIATAVTTGMANVSTAFTTGFATLAPVLTGQFGALAIQATMGMVQISTAVTTGMVAVMAAFTTGFAGLAPALTGQFGALAIQATMGMVQISTAVTTGMVAVQAAFTTGFASLAPLLTGQFGALAIQATMGMTQIATAITTGMTTVNAAFTAGFVGVSAILAAQFGALSIQAAMGMALVAQGVTNGMVAVTAAFTVGWATVTAGLTAALAAIVAQVTASMAQITAAVVVGAAAMNAAMTVGFAQLSASVVAGMAAAVAAVVTGAAQMTAAVVQLGATITSTITAAMSGFASAVTAGMSQATSAVTAGISAMVSALNGAVGQFRAAGSNMGAALAAGLRSQLGAVRAAADALASEAARAVAARAQIASPSKVFLGLGSDMGTGLAIGLASEKAAVIREARALTDAMSTEFTKVDLMAGLDNLDQVHASVRHELGALDEAPAAAAGGVQITQNFNVPSAERASDKASHDMRRLNRLGMFGG